MQEARCLHLVTFSCYQRAPLLGTARARDVFEQTFEQTRQWYGFYVSGYVVMPEHVHLLMSEPERAKLSVALQMLKQNVARRLRSPEGGLLWQPRYYDFILRLACLERSQADREVALPAPKSGEARFGAESGELGVEQFSSLSLSFRR
jgi:REP element-mobilizing transposase RayT